MLLGAFTWIGETRAFGLIANHMPKPAAFAFDFKANSKVGSTKMDFADGVGDRRQAFPAAGPQARHGAPARAAPQGRARSAERHHGGVRAASNPNPCDRRLPIFDGKERFDLVLSYKGQMKVSEQQPSGQPAIAHVCRVKYQPIAGHKVDTENSFMATTDGIEVALAPDPQRQRADPLSDHHSDPGRLRHARLQARGDRNARQAADRPAALSCSSTPAAGLRATASGPDLTRSAIVLLCAAWSVLRPGPFVRRYSARALDLAASLCDASP